MTNTDKTALKLALFTVPFNTLLAAADILYANKVTDNTVHWLAVAAIFVIFIPLFFLIKRETDRPYLYNVLTFAAHTVLAAASAFILYTVFFGGWEVFQFIFTAAASEIYLFILLLTDMIITYDKSKR